MLVACAGCAGGGDGVAGAGVGCLAEPAAAAVDDEEGCQNASACCCCCSTAAEWRAGCALVLLAATALEAAAAAAAVFVAAAAAGLGAGRMGGASSAVRSIVSARDAAAIRGSGSGRGSAPRIHGCSASSTQQAASERVHSSSGDLCVRRFGSLSCQVAVLCDVHVCCTCRCVLADRSARPPSHCVRVHSGA